LLAAVHKNGRVDPTPIAAQIVSGIGAEIDGVLEVRWTD
jgi:uncharacterized membrane protein YhiD involved in acid resistance